MKKILFSLVVATSTILQVKAGGLVTNTNQSAMFTRLQNRNASTGIDAVYYNPAGLPKLGDGFFLSLNNQTISQTKTVLTDFAFLNGKPREYVGNVSAPLYPGVYAAYNAGNFSFSAGFNPIGGGGGAKYDDGLPSFEMPISVIPGTLSGLGIPTNRYSADIIFEGSSIFFGYQVNVAYKINEQISIGAGIRMVSAKNTYEGSIRNIMINPNQPAFGAQYNGTAMNSATTFFQDGSNMFTQLSAGATTMATNLTAAMSGGLPAGTPISEVLTPEQYVQFATILGAAGIDAAGMNLATAIGTLNGVAPQYAATAGTMAGYSAQTRDTYADVEEKGTGFSPILSINYAPSDKFNFSLRYEFKTNLKLSTKVTDGKGAGIFKDGEEITADMPALLAIGAEIRPIDKLAIAVTFNTFFDKNVDYRGRNQIVKKEDMIKRNYLEYGFGVEYSITDKLRASVGWLGTNTGILPEYQNDQRFSSNSNSFGLGVGYRISPMIDINVGGQYSINADYDRHFTQNGGAINPLIYTETYGKKTMIFAIGLDFHFGKKKVVSTDK